MQAQLAFGVYVKFLKIKKISGALENYKRVANLLFRVFTNTKKC